MPQFKIQTIRGQLVAHSWTTGCIEVQPPSCPLDEREIYAQCQYLKQHGGSDDDVDQLFDELASRFDRKYGSPPR